MPKITAILLNHETGFAGPVAYDGQLKTLRRLLGVKWVDARMMDAKNVAFFDDEFMDKGYTAGWKITYNGDEFTVWGSMLITGDEAGRNAPLALEGALHITHFQDEGQTKA